MNYTRIFVEGNIPLSEYCKEHKLNYSKIYMRMKIGIPFEIAINETEMQKRKKTRDYEVVYQGKTYTLYQAAKMIPITYSSVTHYAKTHKISIQEAFDARVQRYNDMWNRYRNSKK